MKQAIFLRRRRQGGGHPQPPVIENQSLAIGSDTLAGDGGIRPVFSGDVSSWAISGGQSANYAIDSSTGYITPASDGSATDADTFTVTATGPVGEDTATITISAAADTYSVRLGTEIDAAVTAHAAGSAVARTIAIRPGVTISDGVNGTGAAGELDTATFLNRDFSAKPLTLTSENQDNRATIEGFRLRVQGSNSIYITYLNFTDPDGVVYSASAGFIYDGGVEATNIRVQHCDFEGRSEASLNATILADTGLSTAWNLFDWYTEYTVDTATNINLPVAIKLSSSTDSVIENNTGERLYMAISCRMVGSISIANNDFHDCYYDMSNIQALSTEDAGVKTVVNNTFGRCFGPRNGVHGGSGPHGDVMQFTTNPGIMSNVTFDGLVTYMGEYGVDSLGDDLQGLFGNDAYKNVVVRRCVLALQTLHGITFPDATNIVIDQCTIIENDPDNPIGGELKPSIRIGTSDSSGVIHIRDCISASASLATTLGTAELTTEGNVLGVNGDVSAYYDGPFDPSSRASAIAAFTPKVGSAIANIGAVTTAGALRTGNRPPAACLSPSLAVDGTTITVTLNDTIWNGGSAVTQQDLRYSTDEAAWTTVTSVTSPHDITGLPANTLHYVQTRDVNAEGNGPWSASASETTASAVSVAVQGHFEDTSSQTTYIKADLAFDSTVEGYAVVAFITRNAAGATHTGVLINDVAANLVEFNNTNATTISLWISDAPISGGSTIDVEATVSPGSLRGAIAAWKLTGINEIASDTAEVASTTGNITSTIDCVAGGVVVGLVAYIDATTTATWTGLSEDLPETLIESSLSYTLGSELFATTQTGITVGVTISGEPTNEAAVFAAFQPAA